MFARSNLVQSIYAKADVKEKTDEELLEELRLEAEEDNNNSKDIYISTNESLFMGYYLKYANFAKKITKGSYSGLFSIFVVIIILVAGINIGLQTYPELAENKVLDIVDYIVSIFFVIELILKIMAEGKKPLNYFLGDDWFVS